MRRAARSGIHSRRTGVGKQIQEPLASGGRAQTLPRQAVVQKQPGIQVVVEVDAEAQTALFDDVIVRLVVDFVVLLASLGPPPQSNADAFGRNASHIRQVDSASPRRRRMASSSISAGAAYSCTYSQLASGSSVR